MKLLRFFPLVVLASLAHGQFYAPDTEYHDIAQRTFPVEAARVLAWQRGLDGEVTFTVETTPARETVWKIAWTGKTPRERTVRYPESLLLEGPRFYREVFAQLTGDDWKPAPAAAAAHTAPAFWQGAEQAGVSRLEAVRAAGKFVAEKKMIAQPADAAQLAGILAHGALPIFATQLTFDSVLLSRAAAWLCVAEAAGGEPLDAPWCAIDFLAGREKTASARWAALSLRPPEERGAAVRLWDLLMHRPGVKDAFVFAAHRENRTVGMPVLTFLSTVDDTWAGTTVEVGEAIFGDPLLERLYDYLPLVSHRAGVGGGHFAAHGPLALLAAWEAALRDLAPGDDGTGYGKALAAAGPADASGEDIPSALRRLAPVLNLGLDQGAGPLRPVAHFTTRDLLGYGWEAAGLQLGQHHRFLAFRLGDPDGALAIESSVLGTLHGADAFIDLDDRPGRKSENDRPPRKAAVPLTDWTRLEFHTGPTVLWALDAHFPKAWQESPDRFLRRGWLWKHGGGPAIKPFAGGKASGNAAPPPSAEAVAAVQRLVEEGGALAKWSILSESGRFVSSVVRAAGVRPALEQELPWAIEPRKWKAWDGSGGDPWVYARALEPLSWETGTAINESYTFLAYLQANALDSARRYYDRIVPYVTETVGFSNTTSPMRWTLAWWEGDDDAMRRALRDSGTYSFSDLSLQTVDAVHRGNLDIAARILTAIAERYDGRADESEQIKAFLPLVPALKDPRHPEHARALDGFPKLGYWNVLQWVILRDLKLPAEEAIRFLGGDAAIDANRGFVAYLRTDKPAFARIFEKERWSSRRCTGALLALMHNDLFGVQPPAEQSDLQPAGAKPLSQLIHETIEAATASEIAASLDLSKYQTAGEFWAAIEKLREPPAEQPDSPEDRIVRYREWLQRQRVAAAAFLKAHPADAHRHDATLMAAGAALQLARIGDRTAQPPDRAELEAIRDAADAGDDARGEADFLLVLLDARELNLSAPDTLPPFHRRLTAFLTAHGSHRRAPEAATMQLQLLDMVETPGADELLSGLAVHPNPRIATPAKAVIEQRARLAELKKQPLDLKFTAADGREIDTAKLRGKVVLLDFWASWCGPCIADAPNVVAAYEKLHGRGFEIIGINLDDNQAAMETAAKRLGITWPQHFDGKAWQSEIVQRFGVRAIPSTWLFDKQGKFRKTGLHGEDLEEHVGKLLGEK